MKVFIFLAFLFFPETAFSNLFCNKNNHKEFIYSLRKTNQLIKQTGKGCQLQNENFNGKDFRYAVLKEADLSHINCRGCDFRNSYLFGANFYGADIRDGDVRDTNLTKIYNFGSAKWKRAKYNKNTKTAFWINLKSYGMTLICDDGKPAKTLSGCWFFRE